MKSHYLQCKKYIFSGNYAFVIYLFLMGSFMIDDSLYGQKVTYEHYGSGSSVLDLAIQGEYIWVVNNLGGIVKVQRTTGDMIHFNHTDPNLRSNNINSLAIGVDGTLWVGGYSGLFAYDGTEWNDMGEIDELFGDVSGIEKVVVDQDNVVWMSHFAGLVRFDGSSTPQVYNDSNSPMSTTLITDLAVDIDGSIWIGLAFDGGLLHLKDGNWNLYTAENSGLFSNRVNHISIDKNGIKWIGSNGSTVGLTRFDGVNWQTYTRMNSGLSAFEINDLAFDENGGIWIGTTNELQYFDGNQWESYTFGNSPLTGRNVNSLQILPGGELWIGVRHSIEDNSNQDIDGVRALLRKNGNEWETYETGSSPLPGSIVNQIEFTNEGNIWLSTYGGGIVYIENEEWKLFNAGNSPLESSYINDIILIGDDELWIAQDFGFLTRKTGNDWEFFTPENSGIPSNGVNALAKGNDGSVWMGTWDRKLVRYHSDTWTVYDSDNVPIDIPYITKIFVDSRGGVWLMSSYDNLAYLFEDEWTLFNSNTTSWPALFMNCLEEDHMGRVWLGTDLGVFIFDQNRWEHFTDLTSGMPGKEVFNIEREDDKMWLNTISGILKYYHDNRWVRYSGALEGSSITDDNTFVLKADMHGNLWAGGLTGLNIIRELPSVAVSPVQINFDSTAVGNCKLESYIVDGFKLDQELLLTSSLSDFQLSLDPDQEFTQELIITSDQTDYTKTIYIQFCPQSEGIVSAAVEHTFSEEQLASISLLGIGYILTGTIEKSHYKDIQIFPNPVENELNYEVPHSVSGTKGMMYIYNQTGRSEGTCTIGSSKGRINVGHLKAGMYTVHILMDNDSTIYIQKFIKLD
jgi:ligand-binding sensor domain-containing protein